MQVHIFGRRRGRRHAPGPGSPRCERGGPLQHARPGRARRHRHRGLGGHHRGRRCRRSRPVPGSRPVPRSCGSPTPIRTPTTRPSPPPVRSGPRSTSTGTASRRFGRDSWRWNAATDRAVLSARAHGLNIIAVAGYAPAWARRSDCPSGELHCFPQNASDYGRFLGAAAAALRLQRDAIPRLRNSVTVWSLWNEPNHQPFSMPKPDPDKYAAMVKSAYVAVKAADASATVLTGGTAPGAGRARRQRLPARHVARRSLRARCRRLLRRRRAPPVLVPDEPARGARLERVHADADASTTSWSLHGDGAKKVWGTEAGAPTGTARSRDERGAAGAVDPRLLRGLEHHVQELHRTARDVPAARQQQRPLGAERQLRPDAPRPHAEARVPRRSGT